MAAEFKPDAAHRTVKIDDVTNLEMILDAGPEAVIDAGKFLKTALPSSGMDQWVRSKCHLLIRQQMASQNRGSKNSK